MKIKNLILTLSILVSTISVALGAYSGVVLKTTLNKQTVFVGEGFYEAFVVSAEVARHYAYKIQSTTNLNQPQWVDEVTSITAMDTNLSLAMPLTASGNKFFRFEELGEGQYVSISNDPASPLTSDIQVTTNDVTSNVPLVIYGFKSHVANGTITNVLIEVVATSPTNDTSYVFNSIKLKVGSLTYLGQVASTSGRSEIFPGIYGYGWKIQFSNITIPLPVDTYVPVTIAVDVAPNTNDTLNGIKIFAGKGGLLQIDIEDISHNIISVEEESPRSSAVLTLIGN
ncbi:MAG: hypothetical protein WCS89_02390 [Candidatus Paceibacterota bacterium]|jgi:hypothetical protein